MVGEREREKEEVTPYRQSPIAIFRWKNARGKTETELRPSVIGATLKERNIGHVNSRAR